MLVFTRGKGEQIVIGDAIVVTVIRVRGRQVHLAIEAPAEISVRRAEAKSTRRQPESPRRKPDRRGGEPSQ